MRIFGSPARYVQGPGVLKLLRSELQPIGQRPFVLCDPVVQAALREQLPQASCLVFSGEITGERIEEASDFARAHSTDCVVAAGGGKTIDCGKGVALTLGLPLVVVPSIASNDAPTSRLIVVYDSEHRVVEVRKLQNNPQLVLVDTEVIARAPARFLAAGMGDALSKAYEVAACRDAGGFNFYGGRTPLAALALAERCHSVIRANGAAAMLACARKMPDDALEDVVEAAILMSGIGFESGGLSLAHALTRGFGAHPATATLLHGEIVGFGLLVQMIHERLDEGEVVSLKHFMRGVALPTSLCELGLADETDQCLAPLIAPTLAAPYIGNLRHPIDSDVLLQCLRKASAL